jgi:hypothetical protein
MNNESITKILLLGILLCLVVLVVQGSGDSSQSGRFTITGMRAGAPVLIRVDSVTGEVWKSELRGGGGVWEPFTEAGDSSTEDEDLTLSELGRPAPAATPPPTEDDLAAAPPPRPAPTLQLPPLPAAPRAPAPSAPPPATDEESIDSFVRAAAREDLPVEIRIWAVRQLGQSDDPRSTDVLLTALQSDDAEVQAAATEALEGRDDPRVAEALAGRQ